MLRYPAFIVLPIDGHAIKPDFLEPEHARLPQFEPLPAAG
jgi:hypothetical protein